MSAQHTPGPWIAREWRSHAITTVGREHHGTFIAIAEVDPAGSGYLADPETLANARLIAAAPDLLALAKQYASECGECNGTGNYQLVKGGAADCPACADIRAVIAKAEGPP